MNNLLRAPYLKLKIFSKHKTNCTILELIKRIKSQNEKCKKKYINCVKKIEKVRKIESKRLCDKN